MIAGGDMRKLAAGARTDIVNPAEIALQENAAFLRGSQRAARRGFRIRIGIALHDTFRGLAQMPRDGFDFNVADRNHRVAAAVGAGGAVDVLLDFGGENLKRSFREVMRREVAAKRDVFGCLGGSEPQDFGQVGNHAPSILPGQPGSNGGQGMIAARRVKN